MKLFLSAILVGAVTAEPALPPGYEDQIWCPPGNCEIYTNPYGFVGGLSSFYLCYDPETDETVPGVWTGSLTDVTPPDDYIEPKMCTASEYSECDTDEDCTLEIEGNTGPFSGWCWCYVSSSFHPYDPCQGADPSNDGCNTDQCTGEECDAYSATCQQGINDQGGYCQLNYPQAYLPLDVE